MKITRERIKARFWASWTNQPLTKDESGVKGGILHLDERELRIGDCYAEACFLKIERDHRDADECVAAGVDGFTRRMEREPSRRQPRSRADYAAWRMSVLDMLAAPKVRPIPPVEVAEMLRERAGEFRHLAGDALDREANVLDAAGSDWVLADRLSSASLPLAVSGTRAGNVPEIQSDLSAF